jgi:hypothetical protein
LTAAVGKCCVAASICDALSAENVYLPVLQWLFSPFDLFSISCGCFLHYSLLVPFVRVFNLIWSWKAAECRGFISTRFFFVVG